MKEIIEQIIEKNSRKGIQVFAPATEIEISKFESRTGFILPIDFKDFYTICNGFSCTDDIFNMISLSELCLYQEDYGNDWFSFAEYMIFLDAWAVRIVNNEEYAIVNRSYPSIILSTSLEEFLKRFLAGKVFEEGGLYDLQQEKGIKHNNISPNS